MYKFRVYHRNAVKEDPETGKLVLDRNEFEQFIGRSVGHSIVALYDGTTERARGLYPNNKYKDEAKSIKDAKEYQEQHPNEKVFYVIEFDITKEQYEGAWNVMKKFEPYVGEEIPKEVLGGMYIILGNNCADLTNTVYRGTGLPGNFTDQMTTPQLDKIPGAVELYVKTLGGFGIGDKSLTVLGTSVEEVAKKYNVPESRVTQKEATPGIPDADFAIAEQAANQLTFVIAPNPALVASAALEGTQIDENFAQLAVTEDDIPELESESKVKSIIEAAIRAFKEKFEAIHDKFTKKSKDDIEKTDKEATELQQACKAKFTDNFQAIKEQTNQKIIATAKQLQSSLEAEVASLLQRMEADCDAFYQQKLLENEVELAQAKQRAGISSTNDCIYDGPGPRIIDLSYIGHQKNSEIEAFNANRLSQYSTEKKALEKQFLNQKDSLVASIKSEASEKVRELKSSIEQKLQLKSSDKKEMKESVEKKEKAQEEKCDRKIKEIQEDTGLIERLKELVGNSGDAEAVVNEELNVFLQGVASDFGVDAVNL